MLMTYFLGTNSPFPVFAECRTQPDRSTYLVNRGFPKVEGSWRLCIGFGTLAWNQNRGLHV
jgi:hypothetical protein